MFHKMQNQKQDFIKKNMLPLIIILIGLMIIALLLTKLLIPTTPPLIKFLDEENNIGLTGSIYLDGAYLGETQESQFDNIPKEFCNKPAKLSLKTAVQTYEWNAYPTDCKAKLVTYKISTANPISAKDQITMNFLIKETSQSISGDLHFDDNLVTSIDGSYKISKEKCKEIKKITLTTEKQYATWQHNPQWCDTNQVIDYKISEKDLLS